VLCAEGIVTRVIDHRADNVRWKHVRRELKTAEAQTHGARERFERQGFGETGHAFKENMTVADEPDNEALDEVLLPDDHAADFLPERLYP